MLFFNEKNGKNFIKWAQNENSKHEITHMTQCSSIDLEKYKEIGLDFHYELHFSNKEQFVRFDCNCFPYINYKDKSKNNFLAQLSIDKHENLYQIRTELKTIFQKEFCNSKYKLSRNQYNYAYLLKYSFNTNNYNDAIEKSEKFINDTYDKILEIIKSVVDI